MRSLPCPGNILSYCEKRGLVEAKRVMKKAVTSSIRNEIDFAANWKAWEFPIRRAPLAVLENLSW